MSAQRDTKRIASASELVEMGFLQPVKRGRPPIYATEEERKTAFRAQQRVCMKKHAERVKEAKRLMMDAQAQNLNNTVQT